MKKLPKLKIEIKYYLTISNKTITNITTKKQQKQQNNIKNNKYYLIMITTQEIDLSTTNNPLKLNHQEVCQFIQQTSIDPNLNNYIQATCHLKHQEITDITKRNCLIHKNTFTINIQSNYPEHNIPQNNWQLLRYDKDSFFTIHQDTQISKLHNYTALLYSNGQTFKGGDLIIMNRNTLELSSVVTRIKTSEFTKPTLVIIPIYWFHCVEPITEGVRCVFKNIVESYKEMHFIKDELCD